MCGRMPGVLARAWNRKGCMAAAAFAAGCRTTCFFLVLRNSLLGNLTFAYFSFSFARYSEGVHWNSSRKHLVK